MCGSTRNGRHRETLDLATGKAVHLKRRAVDLLKTVVIPVRHGGQRHRVFRVKRQTGPDQAKTLFHGVVNQI
jgi:hypothetical protein